MILEIPCTPGEPLYSQRTALDGREYVLDFNWNARDAAWYMSIADESEQPIRSGIRIVLDWPLLRRVRDSRCPPGSIMAIDTAQTSIGPGLDDLGARVKLYYLDAAELAAIRSA